MPVDNPNPQTGGGAPVVKATAIGQRFIGALCDFPHARARQDKDGKPRLKENGKPMQQLVVTAVAMPGTTCVVGRVGEERAIEVGEVVRLLLNGGAFGSWIEAEKEHRKVSPSGARVGDVVEWTIDHAQAWDDGGGKRGGEIKTNEEAARVPRGVSLGFYGPVTLRAATAAEAQWDDKACAIYRDRARPTQDAAPVSSGDEPW